MTPDPVAFDSDGYPFVSHAHTVNVPDNSMNLDTPVMVRMNKTVLERIDAFCDGETKRSDIIRIAIMRELNRREYKLR